MLRNDEQREPMRKAISQIRSVAPDVPVREVEPDEVHGSVPAQRRSERIASRLKSSLQNWINAPLRR